MILDIAPDMLPVRAARRLASGDADRLERGLVRPRAKRQHAERIFSGDERVEDRKQRLVDRKRTRQLDGQAEKLRAASRDVAGIGDEGGDDRLEAQE